MQNPFSQPYELTCSSRSEEEKLDVHAENQKKTDTESDAEFPNESNDDPAYGDEYDLMFEAAADRDWVFDDGLDLDPIEHSLGLSPALDLPIATMAEPVFEFPEINVFDL